MSKIASIAYLTFLLGFDDDVLHEVIVEMEKEGSLEGESDLLSETTAALIAIEVVMNP